MSVKPLLYINEAKHYDYEILLTEAELKKLAFNKPIEQDHVYLNRILNRDDIKEKDVKNYDGALFVDYKDDMETMATKICNSVQSIKGVESAFVTRSDKPGISTYITIKFKHPTIDEANVTEEEKEKAKEEAQNDSQFYTHFDSGFGQNNGVGAEFKLKLRLSSHEPVWTDAYIDINIVDKVYQYFKKRVIARVKERINYINTAWNNYIKYRKLPKKQTERNRERTDAKNAGVPVIRELLKHIKLCVAKSLKESFGGARLRSIVEVEAENVLQYLDMSNVKLEDIVAAVESEFRDEPIVYAKLLAICAECLVENVIEYTFDGDFDYDLLFNDIREKL